jgi:hypothetical protein
LLRKQHRKKLAAKYLGKFVVMAGLLALALAGCGPIIRESPTRTLTVTLSPTTTKTPVDIDATATAIPAEWQMLHPGLEIRRLEVNEKPLLAVRVDLAQISPKVHYDPQTPKTVAGWQAALPDALVVVNAGFFEPDNTTSGLLILDGVAVGESFDPAERYLEHSGMLTISGEQAEIHMLFNCPPSKCTQAEQGVQGLPVLIQDSFPVDFALPEREARRTVVGMDKDGNLLLIVAYEQVMTLIELSDALLATDLELVSALNLDGGPSTGMSLDVEGHSIMIDSISEIPSVIALYAP